MASRGRRAILFSLCISGLAMGCITVEIELSGSEAEAILAYAGFIAENLLQGLNDNNYAKYSQDFSQEMKRGIPAASFPEHREHLLERIGTYISISNPTVLRRGKYVSVIYEAEFEKSSAVTVKVVFLEDEAAHHVHGLWYDSPKLRS